MARYFTPNEVEALIPVLEHHFGQLALILAEAQRTRSELADAAPARAAVLRELLDALTARANDVVSRVQKVGGQIKDLERGLVDFPCRRGNEVVLLCWQFGEKQLGWWHGTDEGFAGRKRLDAPEQAEMLLN